MRRKRRRSGFIILLLAVVFIVYTAVSMLILQAQINRQKELSAALEQELIKEQVLNAAYKAAAEKELDEIALIRDILGYSFPEEIILVDISKIR
jgi:uncharacterized membrane protein affecting hemolysin expression